MTRTEGRARLAPLPCTAALCCVLAAMALACSAPQRRRAREPRQAITVTNAHRTLDICRVLVRPYGADRFAPLAEIDPIAPGRSRTLRIRHGRWAFRFEACERAMRFDSPQVDIAISRVVFLLCSGDCDTLRAPQGAVVVRHNAQENDWGITPPVYERTGRRRARFVL